jgi:transcriptional regulator of acetoin/glycerol metabolism
MTHTKTSADNQVSVATTGGSAGSLEHYPAGLHGSWERSIGHGLRRQDRALFNNCVSRALTRRIVDENDALISHAREEMRNLHRSLDSGRWLTMCINMQGEIVHFVGDRSSAPRELQVLMFPGRRILEAELGTTAPGCALEEQRPIVVARNEHFLLELREFFCASAPIFDPTSQLAGALDISGVDVRALPLASDLVDFAARRIFTNMVGGVHDCRVLGFIPMSVCWNRLSRASWPWTRAASSRDRTGRRVNY